jgi:hypothetical protein
VKKSRVIQVLSGLFVLLCLSSCLPGQATEVPTTPTVAAKAQVGQEERVCLPPTLIPDYPVVGSEYTPSWGIFFSNEYSVSLPDGEIFTFFKDGDISIGFRRDPKFKEGEIIGADVNVAQDQRGVLIGVPMPSSSGNVYGPTIFFLCADGNRYVDTFFSNSLYKEQQ